MKGSMYLEVPSQSRGGAQSSAVCRSRSFDSPRSPTRPQSDSHMLSQSLGQTGLTVLPSDTASSAAFCNRGPVTSHPMIQRRAPPPYHRSSSNNANTSTSSIDSLEIYKGMSSASSVNSIKSELSTPEKDVVMEDEIVKLRAPKADVRKTRSDDNVLSKMMNYDDADRRLGSSPPTNERKMRLKLDPAKFFPHKNPFHGSKSPRSKRKTVPVCESPDNNKRISAPADARIFEASLSEYGKSDLNERRHKKTNTVHGEQSFLNIDRQMSLFESMNLENGRVDPMNLTFPLSNNNKNYLTPHHKKKSLIKSPSAMRRNGSKPEILEIPQEGDLWLVISYPDEPSIGSDFEVQRIPQYDRYLSELMNETEQSHPDYDDLAKTAEKVSNMVKERQEEMTHAENEYKVESVQERFPNDDLELNEKERTRVRTIQTRRRSAPSAVLLKTLSSSKNKSSQQSVNRPLPFLPDELPTKPQPTSRTYLLEGPVQMSEGVQTFERCLFLFNDLLLVAKKKSPTAYKLKCKIRLCEVWLAHCIEEVCEIVCPPERSFVIGWPTTNLVATFSSTELRDLWWAKLRSQISIEKRREEPKEIHLKILNKDLQAYASFKTIDIRSGEEASEVIRKCLDQFEISDADVKDYQIWVSSGKDPPNTAYPLIGHEDVYSIKMTHVRDAIKHKGDPLILPCDTDFGSETVPPEFQVEFYFKRKGMSCPHIDDIKKKGSKKSPIITLFNRPKTPRRESSVPGTSPGKFFGQRLADISTEDDPPKPIMDMLSKLFHHGPFTQGIFRRSANARMVRELQEAIDTETDVTMEDQSILVIGDTVKSFFREMPGCVFSEDLYEKFLATNNLPFAERADELKRLVETLPRCNQKLLRHLFCVLHHIHLKSGENQMTASNLAICIGPSLLKPPESQKPIDAVPTSPLETHREAAVVEFMIEHLEAVFGAEAIGVFGELRPRQDSSTDSDSLQSSHGRLETNVILRREDSSSDSLNHDLDSSEMESSPRLGKSHLSPTNLSRDSGLTLSDSQLYDDDVIDDAHRYEALMTSQQQQLTSRQKRRVSEPTSAGQQIDTNRLYARMVVPGNGMLTSNMGQQLVTDRSKSAPQAQVTLRQQPTQQQQQQSHQSKRTTDHLKSLKEGRVADFAKHEDSAGYLKKSSSGARIFFDDEYVSTRNDKSKSEPASSGVSVETSVASSQSSAQFSPHTYRKLWLTDNLEHSGSGDSSVYRSSSPHRQAIQARLSASILDDRRRQAGTHSAPGTPGNLSPAHRALSPSRSTSSSPSHQVNKPHLVVSARRVFEQHLADERRRQQSQDNLSSSDDEFPRRDSRRKVIPNANVRTMVASLEKSNSETNVLDRLETSPKHRPDKPPTYQEAIHRKNMMKQSDEHLNRHRDRLVTRCHSDHHQPPLGGAPSGGLVVSPGVKRSQSEKDKHGVVGDSVARDSGGESGDSPSRALSRSHGKRGVFYIPSTRSGTEITSPRDNPYRYSTGAILDTRISADYPTSLSPPPTGGSRHHTNLSSPPTGDVTHQTSLGTPPTGDPLQTSQKSRPERRNSREKRSSPPDLDSVRFSEESFV